MYKIACLAHAIKGNRVANFGDIVFEKDLNGNAKDLEAQGYIVKATEADLKNIKKEELNLDQPVSDMKKDELIAYAEKLGVELTDEESNNDKRAAKIQAYLDAEERKALETEATELKVEFTEETSTEDLKASIAEAKK